jgi:hypothetical protein
MIGKCSVFEICILTSSMFLFLIPHKMKTGFIIANSLWVDMAPDLLDLSTYTSRDSVSSETRDIAIYNNTTGLIWDAIFEDFLNVDFMQYEP